MEPKSLCFQCFLSIMLTEILNLGEVQGGEIRTCIRLSYLSASFSSSVLGLSEVHFLTYFPI